MSRPPPLTQYQKNELAHLEPQLRACARTANLDKAKELAAQIQGILRKSGHETRLLQAKNWLSETALEAGNLTFAKMGFEGTMAKSNSRTRINLEATALLAICYLRERNLEKAQELISKAVESIGNITSAERRKQFHRRLVQRLEEEGIVVGLADESGKPLQVDEVDAEAVRLIMSKSEAQILVEMGKAIPQESLDYLKSIRDAYSKRLPAPDQRFLPPPLTKEKKEELGRRASSALKRVAWRALCSTESEIYKAWSQGLSVVYDKKYIAAAIVASFNSVNISATMLAASAAALAVKFGAEFFCEAFAPQGLMIDRNDQS
ncbi:MAG: hypothetical protein L0Y43_07825 [Methylococcaceae bacterium]|nr:hypothetical protein [Methylococcaceae bacterium]